MSKAILDFNEVKMSVKFVLNKTLKWIFFKLKTGGGWAFLFDSSVFSSFITPERINMRIPPGSLL